MFLVGSNEGNKGLPAFLNECLVKFQLLSNLLSDLAFAVRGDFVALVEGQHFDVLDFEVVEELRLVLFQQQQGASELAGSRRSADAVDEVGRVLGYDVLAGGRSAG